MWEPPGAERGGHVDMQCERQVVYRAQDVQITSFYRHRTFSCCSLRTGINTLLRVQPIPNALSRKEDLRDERSHHRTSASQTWRRGTPVFPIEKYPLRFARRFSFDLTVVFY